MEQLVEGLRRFREDAFPAHEDLFHRRCFQSSSQLPHGAIVLAPRHAGGYVDCQDMATALTGAIKMVL